MRSVLVTVSVPFELLERVKGIAHQRGRPVAALFRESVELALDGQSLLPENYRPVRPYARGGAPARERGAHLVYEPPGSVLADHPRTHASDEWADEVLCWATRFLASSVRGIDMVDKLDRDIYDSWQKHLPLAFSDAPEDQRRHMVVEMGKGIQSYAENYGYRGKVYYRKLTSDLYTEADWRACRKEKKE